MRDFEQIEDQYSLSLYQKRGISLVKGKNANFFFKHIGTGRANTFKVFDGSIKNVDSSVHSYTADKYIDFLENI